MNFSFTKKYFLLFKNRWAKAHYFFWKRHRRKTQIGSAVLLLAYWFCIPSPLFDTPTSTILEDKDGNLLGARIAADGQWRFPALDSVPTKFEACILEFEDRYFYYHIGVNPLALVRAVGQNLRNTKVVSGGSTLTMQVIRMARNKKNRNIFSKLIEAIMATRLTLTYSKKSVLSLYAANAPFGGNVVGIEAASWRYFGKRPADLSWGEAATLAVLPNAPALLHLSRNREALVAKRNRLLDRLILRGVMPADDGALAKAEPLPEAPLPLPQLAPHLLDRAYSEKIKSQNNHNSRIKTTIDATLQQQVSRLLALHHTELAGEGVHNIAALVLDVRENKVLSYIGNVKAGQEHGEAVDIIRASRSTGSTLKPFLYAFAQQEGEILPNSLLTDVPTEMGGFHPENFNETYDGVVPVRRALARSLNIPFVRLLSQYGIERFHQNLKKMGLTTIDKSAEFYGLPIVLGGAEGNLWEITSAFASVSRVAQNYYRLNGKYDLNDWNKPNYIIEKNLKSKKNLTDEAPILNAASCWLALDAMKEVERPTAEGNWEFFESSKTVAWKTGTSFGFRDAWAIGTTPRYAVGVWVGNADGEGRPGLIGVEKAAPILFDIFNLLPINEWYDAPFDDMKKIAVCRQSGFRASPLCDSDTIWAAKGGERVKACPYHQIVHLDPTEKYQVADDCEQPTNMVHKSWFMLPPLEEYYFKSKNPNYTPPPQYRADCRQFGDRLNPMQLIYPKSGATRISVPIDLGGKPTGVTFRLAHSNPETQVYWHIDNQWVGTTKTFHQVVVTPSVGKHRLVLVDEKGYRIEQSFEVMPK